MDPQMLMRVLQMMAQGNRKRGARAAKYAQQRPLDPDMLRMLRAFTQDNSGSIINLAGGI